MEDKPIPPSRKALAEARDLSAEILKNLELSDTSLTNIALKASRVARLLNEFVAQQIFIYEASGYPIDERRNSSLRCVGTRGDCGTQVHRARREEW